ncbi:DUF927 domain-containing protein, partial [Dactylosporangium sp. CA-139066]
ERTTATLDAESRYLDEGGCIYIVDEDGGRTLLAEFDPRILSEVIRDDGTERLSLVQIRVTLPNGYTGEAEIPAEEAPKARKWAAIAVGAHATIMPMSRAEDHVWTATQILSRGRWTQTVRYAHTGWRNIGGKYRFLTTSGAIGADGLDPTVAVDLGSEALNRYWLPDPTAVAEGDLRAAVAASLDMLRIAPDAVMVPILAAVYRAPLPGDPETTVWVHGPSGSLKSAVLAVAQQHFGPAMNAKALPTSWTSTGNVLEGLANVLKDVLMVIDDYAPQSVANLATLNAAVDRVVRGSANAAGRQRMNADATIRPPKPPHAQLMSSGEDLPSGQSLRARMTAVPTEPGNVDKKLLTEAQKRGRDGVYALCMAGYVRWIASQMDANPTYANDLQQQIIDLRDDLGSGGHLRLPEATAGLLTGWRVFLDFAVAVKAVTATERDELFARCKAALGALAGEQHENTKLYEPVQIYLSAIDSALVGGYAHLADRKTNDVPELGGTIGYRQLGWERVASGDRVDYRPRGEQVGWIDKDGVYLYPANAHSVATAQAKRMHMPLATTKETLHKELHRQGILAAVSKDGKLVVSKRVGGTSLWVLHVRSEVLFNTTPAPTLDPVENDDQAAETSETRVAEVEQAPRDEQLDVFDGPPRCPACSFGFDEQGHALNCEAS